jgi:hypothetical protein
MVGAPIDGTTTKVDRWQPLQAAIQGTDDGIAALISFPGSPFFKPGLPGPFRYRDRKGGHQRLLQAEATGQIAAVDWNR